MQPTLPGRFNEAGNESVSSTSSLSVICKTHMQTNKEDRRDHLLAAYVLFVWFVVKTRDIQ